MLKDPITLETNTVQELEAEQAKYMEEQALAAQRGQYDSARDNRHWAAEIGWRIVRRKEQEINPVYAEIHKLLGNAKKQRKGRK